MKSIPKIAVIGSYTADYRNSEITLGGIFYSTYGIWKSGGKAYVITSLPSNFKIQNPFSEDSIILGEGSLVKFKIILSNNKRKIYILNNPNKIVIDLKYFNYFDGILLNPMFNEILLKNVISIKCPIALDLQGIVRERNSESMVVNNFDKVVENLQATDYNLVVHGNNEELPSSKVHELLYKFKFREVIRSHGENGLEFFTTHYSKYFNVENVGEYNVGNGDVLLASYFTYRLMGYDEISSILLARKLVEEFSIHGPPLILRINQY